MSDSRPRLSVVIPVFDEEESISALWEEVRPILERLGLSWEVLFIDDGSTDGSLRAMLALRRHEPRVRVFHLEENQGQSSAFWCGFRNARGDVVVTIDADLQNDPADIPLLLEALEGADLAIGWRREREDPFLKRVSSRIANGFRNRVTGEDVHDVGCSLKAFRRGVLDHAFPWRGMHRFYPTLARLAGFRVVEVPVRHRPRARGRSKYGVWNRLVGPFLDCLAVRWMKTRSIAPEPAKEIADGESP